MNRNELLGISGLRSDGRKANEIRRISTGIGNFIDCDGSAYLEMGNTKVQAVVYGPRQCPKITAESEERASISSLVTMSPYAKIERKLLTRKSHISTEYATAICRCFEHVILTTLYPRSEISIHVTILSSDGGDLPCCLNAALLAVINAGIAIIDFQVAIDVGYMDNTIILDMNTAETKLNGIVLTVAYLPKCDKFTLVTMDNNIPINLFGDILKAAKEGCKQIYSILSEDVLENAKKMYLANNAYCCLFKIEME